MYDTRILPLLHRMSNLTHLTLDIRTQNRSRFIDGTHLEKEIISHMSQLNTFDFYIKTNIWSFDTESRQSREDIQRTFTNWKFGEVKCYVDDFEKPFGRFDIYSVPYKFRYLCRVTNSFRGDFVFKYVIILGVCDIRPFEHDFFYWISNAFPSLRCLVVKNEQPQERKRSNEMINFPAIHYPKLKYLNVSLAHIDYINQLLSDEKTRFYQPFNLRINYEQLITVTNNFTNECTRINCSKVQWLNIDKSIVFPENVYKYFPLL